MIAVLTDPAVGGTFVSWSLHYLAGHESYFVAEPGVWNQVPDFPLTSTNAHLFQPNQPVTAAQFDTVVDSLRRTATDTFHTLYLHNFLHSSQSQDPELAQRIQQISPDSQLVVISNPANMALYHASYRPRAGTANLWSNPAQVSTDHDEIFEDFVTHFFAESLNQWRQQQLTDIWDRREFIALNFAFDQVTAIEPNIDPLQARFALNTLDLWHTFDHTVIQLFDWLGLTITSSRWHSWNAVYQQWRHLHRQRMQFAWYFDAIVDAVIQGQNIDLTRFDLDLVQEAAIQNRLIKQHNLNLKTWQLERFSNTQQLHDLLETNIHN